MTIPSHPRDVPPVTHPELAPVRPSHGGGAVTGGVSLPRDTHYDPAGNPISFTSSSVRDQQMGGDLTGHASDRRDDNFRADTVADGSRQLRRDVEVNDGVAGAALPEVARHHVEPDGTEDPLANIDDGLLAGSGNAPKTPPGTPDGRK